MKIIVPMAGRGSRLRPHTLTVPKPLIPIAGKSIVHRLVEDITKVLDEKVDEVAFVIGKDFGEAVAQDLKDIAHGLGAKGTVYIQDKPLGTGHAIMCAKESLQGPAVVAYADTLFKADFTLDTSVDGVMWVKQVKNPEAFGVVKLNEKNQIIDLVEKPQTKVSDLAVIGIYYFKDVAILKELLQEVIDENIIRGGEYQINDGITKMRKKGYVFKPGKVDQWMDCGNKTVAVDTNARVLNSLVEDDGEQLVANSATTENSKIIEPCFIGENVELKNSTIGPHVSIGKDCKIANSTLKNSLIQTDTIIQNADLDNAMIGNHVKYNGNFSSISIGDYSVLE